MASKRATPISDTSQAEVDTALEMAQDVDAYRKAKADDDGSRVSLSALRAAEVVEQYGATIRRLEDA